MLPQDLSPGGSPKRASLDSSFVTFRFYEDTVQLGVTTTAANEHMEEYLDREGVTKQRKLRDSDGDPKASLLRRAAKKTKDAEIQAQVTTDVPNGAGKVTAPTKAGAAELCDKKTTSSRSRLTTVYGYAGKNSNDRRLKEWVSGNRGKTTTLQPTKEWLQREGARLTTAASLETSTFLNVQEPVRVATATTAQNAVQRCTESAGEDLEPLARSERCRPIDNAASAAKRVRLSMLELLNPRGSGTVQ